MASLRPSESDRERDEMSGSALQESMDYRAWNAPPWLPASLLTILVAGALAPLADPDLPMHLAVGRWIAEHRAVPTAEPFAWTRPGAPYFAYSWLAQLAMYVLMHVAGPLALRLLHGTLLASAFLSVVIAGRALAWTRDTTCIVAAAQLLVLTALSPLLRPQECLFVLLPLSWALVARATDAGSVRTAITLCALALISAIAANTHILFPLLAAPVSLALTRTLSAAEDALVQRLRRAVPAAAAIALGMLCSPYALYWTRVFELNFGANALFGQSSPIAEYQPGFSTRLGLGVVLTVMPVIASGTWTRRERVIWGALWTLGLIVFALKAKGLVVWWFLSFPLVGLCAEKVLSASPAYRVLPPVLAFVIPTAAAFGFVFGVQPTIVPIDRAWRAESADLGRGLSSPAALATDTLLGLLAGSAHGTRVLTVFDLGSYMTWRAPRLSASIDGRTIFPDSAALPDTPLPPTAATRPLGPWRSADVAIVPLSYPVAAVLDTAPEWERIARSHVTDSPFGPIGLWIRRR